MSNDNDSWKPAGQQRYEDFIKENPTDVFGNPRKDWASLEGCSQRRWAAPEMKERYDKLVEENANK